MLFEMVLETIAHVADWVGHRVIRAWRAVLGRRAPPPSDARAWWVGVGAMLAVVAGTWMGLAALTPAEDVPSGGAAVVGTP